MVQDWCNPCSEQMQPSLREESSRWLRCSQPWSSLHQRMSNEVRGESKTGKRRGPANPFEEARGARTSVRSATDTAATESRLVGEKSSKLDEAEAMQRLAGQCDRHDLQRRALIGQCGL